MAIGDDRPAGAGEREEYAYALGVQALLWGYPFVCYARASEAAVRVGASHVNAFRLHTELKTAADRYVVTPNNVTLDGYAALDLRQKPVVVHVPALTAPRWYVVQIGDAFDEVVANVGGIKGRRAGAYAVCGPDFHGELPGDISEIRVRTTHAICATRVFVSGQGDTAEAVATLRGFHAMPLSAYLREGLQYEPPAGPRAARAHGRRARRVAGV